MIIPAKDYNIIDQDVPVLTHMGDGVYSYTNCWFVDFNINSEVIPNILSAFDYKNDIMQEIHYYNHSRGTNTVLLGLTNSNLAKQGFDAADDVLSVALFLERINQNPVWGDFFEVNEKYRSGCEDCSSNRKYKRVGESALKCFQQKYINRGIAGRAHIHVQPFYFKYGFKRYDSRECYLIWERQR